MSVLPLSGPGDRVRPALRSPRRGPSVALVAGLTAILAAGAATFVAQRAAPPPVPAVAAAEAAVTTTLPVVASTPVDPARVAADGLSRQADALLERGDVAPARLVYTRLADAGDPRGAVGLARSYDAAALRALPVMGDFADAGKAAYWSAKATEWGMPPAR